MSKNIRRRRRLAERERKGRKRKPGRARKPHLATRPCEKTHCKEWRKKNQRGDRATSGASSAKEPPAYDGQRDRKNGRKGGKEGAIEVRWSVYLASRNGNGERN